MTLLMLAVVGALSSLLAIPVPVVAADSPQRVIGYMGSWQIYEKPTFPVDMIHTKQAEHLTHLFYAFAGVSKAGECISMDTFSDYQMPFLANQSIGGVADTPGSPLNGSLNQVKLFKGKYPNVRTSIVLEGGPLSWELADVIRTPQSRKNYVSSCVDLFIKGNLVTNSSLAGVFDGIDLDWQLPTVPGGGLYPDDQEHYGLLAKEFRNQLDAYGKDVGRNFELSAQLPVDPRNVDVIVEGKSFFETMDFVTIPGHGFRGPSENHVGHQTNLYIVDGDQVPGGRSFSLESAVDKLLCVGAPADKIVVGVSAAGYGWAGVPVGDRNGLYQKSTSQINGSDGRQDYKTLIARNLTTFTDYVAGASYAYDGNEFWSFDTKKMIGTKMGWANKRGLGGAIISHMEGDNGDIIKAMDDGLRKTAGTYCSTEASESEIKLHIFPQRCKQLADSGKAGAAGRRKQLDIMEAIARRKAC